MTRTAKHVMRNPYLVGEKVYLRALEEADAAECYPWFSDPDVRRTLDTPVRARPNTEAVSRDIIRGADARHAMMFAIVTRAHGVHIGNCELGNINHVDGRAELGIAIGRRDHWGRGYATEAVALLCRHAFEGLNLHRVYLGCWANNPRALAVYGRVGFRTEGRRRQHAFIEGQWVDEVVLGLLRGELKTP